MAFSTASNPLSAVPKAGQVVIQGDFDGDGDIDVLAYPDPAADPSYFENNGSGVFTSVLYASSPFAGVDPEDLFWNSESTYVADFDNDGDLDIWDYMGNDTPSVNGPGIYLQNNGGTYVRLAGNDNPLKDVDSFMDFAIHGDFDGDGDEDVLSWMEDGTSLEYFRNNGSGSFAAVAYASSPFSSVALADQFYAARNTHVADFDGDGDLDIWDAAGDVGHGGTPVYLQNNGGIYTRLTDAANPLAQVAISNQTPYSIVGDFDTDGDVDVLGFDATGYIPEYFQNDGSGHFTKLPDSSSPFAGIAQPFWDVRSTYVADFDNDGDVDVWDFMGNANAIYVQQLGAAPRLSASTPLDNATDVVPAAPLVLQFNEVIATAGTGSIRIVRATDDVVMQTIAANSGSVTGWGTAMLSIAHTPLADLTGYYVLVDKQAFRDADGAVFAGIADKTTLNFTTGSSNVAPTATNLTQIVGFTEDAGSVALGDIVITESDAGDTLTATLTLSNAAAGTLTTGTFGAVTSTYNAGTGVWTVSGVVADVNAALASVAFAPAANWDQDLTITTRVRDAASAGPADGTITLNATAVNDGPIAVADSVTVAEGGTATILIGGSTSVLTNDTDADGDPLTAILVAGPANGTLTLNANGTFSYSHNSSETTTDSFTYKVNDGTVDGNTVTVSINVTPVNDAPVAVADSLTVVAGATATVLTTGDHSVLANDTDPDGNPLTAVLVTGPVNGTLTLNANGTFSYMHNGSATTSDSFTYKVNDSSVDGNTVTVTISVTPANDAPTVANAIPNQNATEDAAFNFQLAANTFADTDGDTLTYSAQIAGGGALPAWLSFDPATRTFSGTPVNASVGTLSVDVTASDGNGGTITDTFNVVVANTNDDPTVFNSVPNQNATEDAVFNFQFDIGTFTDEDVGDTLTYSAQLAGGGALPAWLSFDAATRTFTGTPGNAHVGTLSVTLIASDGHGGGTATDTFDIVVANTNDAPTVANPIANRTGTEGVAFNFQFAANAFADVDVGDTLTYSAQLAGGGALPVWLTFNPATRTFSGTPAGTGTVSIDVIADDGHGGTVTDTFDVVISTAPVVTPPEPEPPVTPPTPNPPTPGIPDNDGIPAIIEDRTPGITGPGGATPVPGDGNGDGIKDSEQAGVASIGFVLSPTGESNPGSAPPTYTTLVASSQDGKVSGDASNSRITSLSQKDAPANLPEGMETPIGLISFTVELAQGKTSESFSLYLDPALGVNGYWKQDAAGTWTNIASEPYGGKMVMEGGRVRLDFQITDGGQFDADGKVDGIITDPGAPGYMPLSITGQAPDVGQAFWF